MEDRVDLGSRDHARSPSCACPRPSLEATWLCTPSGSLFQINHWIETTPAPRPSNAAIVNAYEFLLKRARACERERRRRVNLLAVDFYRTGDLFRVARTLNGLDSAGTH